MQTLYSLEQCRKSDLGLAEDQIKENFQPNLNTMDFQDPDLLKKKTDEALKIFRENYQGRSVSHISAAREEVLASVQSALNLYHSKYENDFRFFKDHMVEEAEKIFNNSLKVLSFVIHFSELVLIEEEERKNSFTRKNQLVSKSAFNLPNNKVLSELRSRIKTKNAELSDDEKADCREIYKKVLKKDEEYQKYISIESPSFDEDKDILLHIIKAILFKNEAFVGYMDSIDIAWTENNAIIKSMSLKSIKLITEENLGSDELAELSLNWEDDKAFFKNLFEMTYENGLEYEEMIAQNSQNWTAERITNLDMIILKMAISEMVHFKSIPIKVTINEYLELAKKYSTPKSKKFINGILDVMAVSLSDKGMIKKSGRGLIDNK
ncbi:transcription antitermination factor NusB [Aureibacter tunicatorum]|uniref:N utilization substance protein B n=1 Tax=Aureibacter tunicatorum TaxID=866807 RepID=A0AAE3XMC1_9BACT|nr:transcription antitermination factor NusB [Aureibacter tunicatorum]MDR6238628.1 N utilization substance protein B [Aureibacter tunicatorum]BDD05441.1 hypothetical protein AUTU_29240 [Aureibacter tunicatorum]